MVGRVILKRSSYVDGERITRDHEAAVYDSVLITEYQHAVEWTTLWGRVHEGFDPRLPILDAGCGTGRFSERLARLGVRVVGSDFSRESLRIARRRTDGAAAFVEADLRQLPFRCRVFHQVLCSQVISHLIDREDAIAALRELSRVLRPGGRLIIIAYNYRLGRRVKDWLRLPDGGRRWSTHGLRLNIGPISTIFYTEAALRDLLCKVFSPQEVAGVWTILHFLNRPLALGRLLPRRLWPLLMRADLRIEQTPLARWLGELWLAEIVKQQS